jgi:hypothetical protein
MLREPLVSPCNDRKIANGTHFITYMLGRFATGNDKGQPEKRPEQDTHDHRHGNRKTINLVAGSGPRHHLAIRTSDMTGTPFHKSCSSLAEPRRRSEGPCRWWCRSSGWSQPAPRSPSPLAPCRKPRQAPAWGHPASLGWPRPTEDH